MNLKSAFSASKGHQSFGNSLGLSTMHKVRKLHYRISCLPLNRVGESNDPSELPDTGPDVGASGFFILEYLI